MSRSYCKCQSIDRLSAKHFWDLTRYVPKQATPYGGFHKSPGSTMELLTSKPEKGKENPTHDKLPNRLPLHKSSEN